MSTETVTGYPDIEAILIEYLGSLASAGEVTPESLDAPFIRVNRVGGFDDGITDRARVEIACYCPTRRESQALSEQARQALLACDGTDAAGVFIDHVITETQAGRSVYPNEDVRRIAAVYRFSLRPARTAG